MSIPSLPADPADQTAMLQVMDAREAEFPELDQDRALLVPDTVAALPPDQNPYLVYLASIAEGESRRAMAGCLDRIAGLWAVRLDYEPPQPAGQHFAWGNLRYQHTAVIRTMLMTQTTPAGTVWAPSYRNKHLTALRMTIKQAFLLGQMTAEDYLRAREVKPVKGVRVMPGRVITSEERQAMVGAAFSAGTDLGLRDAALIAVLYSTGARRDELARVTRDDYSPGTRTLLVTGKGNKQRETYLTETAAAQLGQWLVTRNPRGPLFPAADRWGNIGAAHMTSNGIGRVVARRSRQAGVPDVTAHDFRRTFTGDLLDRGVDLATIQQLLGHADASTTARYDRRPAATRRAAVDRLDQVA